MITPAISVLSRGRGAEVATPFFDPYVLPITIAILVGLFLFQRKGTAGIGKVFGPVMIVWFMTLAVLGLTWILREPQVLHGGQPGLRRRLLRCDNRRPGFLVLGSVFLVVTGGEALYADMGHFGRRPIQIAWFTLVLPALLLNYFGQGALLLQHPEAADEPVLPAGRRAAWALYPLVVLATVATVIASQAVISGAFSLTRQAVQLGYMPAHRDRPHLGGGDRADLHPVGELGADVRHHRPGARLPELDQPGRGLRRRGHDDHGRSPRSWPRSWRAGSGAGARALVLPVAALFLLVDSRFFGANLIKIAARRLVPAGGRHRHLHAACRPGRRAARSSPSGCGEGAAAALEHFIAVGAADLAVAGAGHGGLHVARPGRHAHGPAPQPQAQQGAAREGRPADGDHRGVPAGAARGRPGGGGGSRARASTG